MSGAADFHDDELRPETTAGFKVGEKKTLEEYQQLVHGLQTLHKHDSIWGSYDKGVLSKYSGGRDRDSKIPRKQSYIRTSTPNALLPSTDDERKWARQVLRYYSSTLDASHCDVFTWHALERKDDPVHLVICHGEMVFMDQYGQELPGQPAIIDQLQAIHRWGMLQPGYEDYEVPLTRIPTRQVEEQTAEHFKAVLERNGSEDLSPPSTVQVGWWLHNSPVYRVKYREAELWMTIDGRNMPNRPAIWEQIEHIRTATDDAMQSGRSSGNVSPSHIAPDNSQETRSSKQANEEQNQDLHQNDESLRKWKESLGIGSGTTIGDASDPRKVIIVSLGLEVEGRPDIIIDLSTPGALESLKSKPFTIKEGATFRMKARFRVQHQILSGMKYVQVVKRMGISNKMQEMIGSYSPNTTDKPEYEKKFEAETAPSGMMARGHYNAVSKFIDDDEQTHLKFEWSFDIKKDW
ncbi:E set domain-containing protein, partial [Aureobasidium melanogenum]